MVPKSLPIIRNRVNPLQIKNIPLSFSPKSVP
jgi:hypothetical protein